MRGLLGVGLFDYLKNNNYPLILFLYIFSFFFSIFLLNLASFFFHFTFFFSSYFPYCPQKKKNLFIPPFFFLRHYFCDLVLTIKTFLFISLIFIFFLPSQFPFYSVLSDFSICQSLIFI